MYTYTFSHIYTYVCVCIGAPNKLANCNVLQLYWQSQSEALALRSERE
jgi:hypothetical protein